jgi:hypothetical protein
MNFTPILAHGSLGNFDEVVFMLIIFIFVGMMVASWMRSRFQDDEYAHQSNEREKISDIETTQSTSKFELE